MVENYRGHHINLKTRYPYARADCCIIFLSRTEAEAGPNLYCQQSRCTLTLCRAQRDGGCLESQAVNSRTFTTTPKPAQLRSILGAQASRVANPSIQHLHPTRRFLKIGRWPPNYNSARSAACREDLGQKLAVAQRSASHPGKHRCDSLRCWPSTFSSSVKSLIHPCHVARHPRYSKPPI